MNISPFARIAAIVAGSALLASCSLTGEDGLSLTSTVSTEAQEVEYGSEAPEVWDASALHTVDISYDPDDYDALVSAYLNGGEKVWISATVTIDGQTFENVGFKLKGNSSLRGTTEEDAESPEDLPWIIRLDKYEDQSLDGATEFVIRSNGSETSLNEALALDILEATGLAAEQAVSVAFTANGSDATLRLMVENPNDSWMERELGDGLLWKAESGGTWDYQGDNPEDYYRSFDQEGGEEDYEPLIEFLDFLNNSSDEEFAAELAERLDVEAFATYLAFQDLVDNFDDIDGPGNNGYLYWDPETEQMTVVNWDLNLAFGGSPTGGGGDDARGGFGNGGGVDEGGADAGAGTRGEGGQRPGGFEPPEGVELPEGVQMPDGNGFPGGRKFDPENLPEGFEPGGQRADGAVAGPGGAEGGFGRGDSNILRERYLEVEEFAAMYEAAAQRLQEEFIDSGLAQELLDARADLLLDEAGGLVEDEAIENESSDLSTRLVA